MPDNLTIDLTCERAHVEFTDSTVVIGTSAIDDDHRRVILAAIRAAIDAELDAGRELSPGRGMPPDTDPAAVLATLGALARRALESDRSHQDWLALSHAARHWR